MDKEWGWKTKKPEGDLCSEVPRIFKICVHKALMTFNECKGFQHFRILYPEGGHWTEREYPLFPVASLCGFEMSLGNLEGTGESLDVHLPIER